MRIYTWATVAAFIAGGAFSASAQTPSPCKGLAEAACGGPTCKWIKPTVIKKTGKPRKGYCRKATSSRRKADTSTTSVSKPAPARTTSPATPPAQAKPR